MSTRHVVAGEFPPLPTTEFFGGVAGEPTELAFCKGAVESLLEVADTAWVDGRRVPLSDEVEAQIGEVRDRMASAGTRVLAVGCRTVEDAESSQEWERNFMLIGLVGLEDPPRPEARQSVARCREAGIRPIMITGDHPLTAISIAKQIGISDDPSVITGRELSQMSEAELTNRVQEASVFARVAPADKLNIVEALKRHDEVVAMTGDGVNDAPALKMASVGVAMGITGTDVSKQAANVVLLDDNFSTIVAAVEQGRTVYDNIRKFVRYTMSSNIGEVLVMTVGVIGGLPMPLLPLQILWVNLVTDGLPGLALAVEPTEPGAMQRRPLPLTEPIFNRRMQWDLLWIGVCIGAVSLLTAAFLIGGLGPSVAADGLANHDTMASAETVRWRTIIFTTLTCTQMANAFACRSEQPFWKLFRTPNYWLLGAVASTFCLQVAVVYLPAMQHVFHTVPLSAFDLAACLGASFLAFGIIESRKWSTMSFVSRK